MNIKQTLLIFLISFSTSVFAETLYVSDELKIAMRSGDTTGHRIIKFIPSGTKLDVLETNDAGTFKLVRTGNGKQGWVETPNLSAQPSARDRIVSIENKMKSLRSSLSKRENEIKQLQSELRDARKQNSKLDEFSKGKAGELAELQKIASRPVQLAREKQQLEIELKNAEQERDRALAMNEDLSDASIKEWFIIGAGVTLLSLFLGLIIPSIRWRKKDTWGGGF